MSRSNPRGNVEIEARSLLPGEIVVSRTVPMDGAYGDYQSIAAACGAAFAMGPTAANPIVVRVGPGVYVEPAFEVKPYVKLIGAGWQSTIIQASDMANDLILLGYATVLRDFGIMGPTNASKSCVYHAPNDPRAASIVEVAIMRGSYGIRSNPLSSRSPLLLQNIVAANGANVIDRFIVGEHFADISGAACIAVAADGTIGTGFWMDGSDAKAIFASSQHECGSGDGVFADNGASVRVLGSRFAKGRYALHIGSGGTGTKVRCSGCMIQQLTGGYTKSIKGESASAIISFSGSMDSQLIDVVPGTTLSMSFSDVHVGMEGSTTLGEFHVGTDVTKLFPLTSYAKSSFLTGLTSGGEVTRNSGLDVDVALGEGFINDGVAPVRVTWTGDTITLDGAAAGKDQWIYISLVAGVPTITHADSEPAYTDVIMLARARTNATDVTILSKDEINITHGSSRLAEYFEHVIGPVIITGGVVAKNGTAYKLDVGFGEFANGLNERDIDPGTAVTFKYWYHDGSGNWVFTTTDTIDPDYYDSGAGKAAQVNDYWKKDALYAIANDDGTEYHVVYSNFSYLQKNAAINGSLPAPPPILQTYGIPLGGILVQQSNTGTDVDTVYDVRPRIGSAVSVAGIAGNHSTLTNLGNDDHAQYQTAGRAATAHAGYSGAHVTGGDSHDHTGGAGAQIDHVNLANKGTNSHSTIDGHLGSTSNPHSVTKSQVNLANVTDDAQLKRAAGDFSSFTGKTPVGADVLLVEDSAAAGVKKSITVDSLPVAVAGVSPGYLSAADKTKLDGIASGATSTPLSSATPQAVGTAAPGSGTSASKDDHVHAHGSQPLGAGTNHAVATASVAGFMSATDKAKGDRRQTLRKTGNTSNASTGFIDAADLIFSLVSGKTYRFKFLAIFQSTNTNTGIKLSVGAGAGAASFSSLVYQTQIPTSGTAMTLGSGRAYDVGTASGSVDTANADLMGTVEGVIVCNGNGNFGLRFGSETGTSVSIRAGSIGILEEVA